MRRGESAKILLSVGTGGMPVVYSLMLYVFFFFFFYVLFGKKKLMSFKKELCEGS